MKDLVEELLAKFSDLKHKHLRFFNSIGTLIRWILTTIVPLIEGVFISIVFEQYVKGELKLNPQSLIDQKHIILPLVVGGILFFIGIVWRIKNTNLEIRLNQLYYALRWLYEDLGFNNIADADIRVTLWTPTRSNVSADKMRIIQLVDYVPVYSKYPGDYYSYRMNKNRGRIRKVAMKHESDIKPVGLVGQCIVASLTEYEPKIMTYDMKDDTVFDEVMINNFNFLKSDVKRITQDRKSYMCIALMNAARTDILGIIFMDARNPGIFTNIIADKAESYLPRIVELLTHDRKGSE